MVNLLGESWQRWRLVIIAIALVFISFSTSSCKQLPLTPGQSPLSAENIPLEFVPKQSVLAGVINTAASTDKTWVRSNLSKALPQSIDAWLTPLDIDFNQDIQPWLGNNIAFAITSKDLDRDQSNGRQAGYLLATDTTDGEQLREFLELFWQRQAIAGTKTTLTTVSGVPIIVGFLPTSQQQLATAVVGDHTLLIANDVKVLQQSLRVAQSPSLQLSSQDCCHPIWLSLRIPDFVDWLGLAAPTNFGLMSAPKWQQLHATTTFYPQRLVINTQLTSLGNLPLSPTKSLNIDSSDTLGESHQYLPDSLAWAAIGQDFPSLWTSFWEELAHYDQLPLPLQQGQQWLSTQLATSLSEPLSQLLASNYAIGQWQDGNWLITVMNTNPTVSKRLDDIAMEQGLTVSQLSIMGQAVTAWSRLNTRLDARNRETTVETDLVVLHTKTRDCDVFATSIDSLTAALKASNDPLFETQRFRYTVQPMDTPNYGYMYGTLDEVGRLLSSNRWFSLVQPILQPWSQSIDAIAITSYEQTVNQSTGTVSILLKD
ncbi:hypothetical protein N836_12095 [Leptolyngbya sp. Heron Island J]|uniref:DUF3352 domain-containing protein n=1 Tax=Leptolyngbya sp. Heron Island J TaxID=1385935 RepID=UPI0003B94090|nr:DUF3352 domain-containing protein [Leptolyngbya sp. Heron Island J]ESA35439.1 hypothetical protein N836_12095 [Leptolyngbya sp. Heron Island J]